MAFENGNNPEVQKSGGISGWWTAVIIVVGIGICSAISWALIVNLAAPKTVFASQMTQINNTVGHMHDLETGLNSFASNQNSKINDLSDSTQGALDSANNKINTVDNKTIKNQTDLAALSTRTDSLANQLTTKTTQLTSQIAGVGQQATEVKAVTDTLTTNVSTLTANTSTLSTNLDTLTTTVNGIFGGTQITPSVTPSTTSGGTGNIALAINAAAAQNMAFRVEFRPTVDMVQSATLDTSLSALYGAPLMTLNEASSTGTAVRGDYGLFWSTADSKYHLGSIVFITQETSVAAGASSKILYFTYKTGTAPSFEILITPIYGVTSTTTGATPTAW